MGAMMVGNNFILLFNLMEAKQMKVYCKGGEPMKVYCKNCEHYPRLGPLRRLARCKARTIQHDWNAPKWVRRYCETKNMGNDCEDYERRGTRDER